ncbi:MAG: hypothetical protein ACRDSF_21115, partial [Pseudonocardiaceae bacterium]
MAVEARTSAVRDLYRAAFAVASGQRDAGRDDEVLEDHGWFRETRTQPPRKANLTSAKSEDTGDQA